MNNEKNIVVIRGGGDIATGVACRLYHAGYGIIISEIKKPSVIRRNVAFAQAVYDGVIVVEGIQAILVTDYEQTKEIVNRGNVAILIDPNMESVKKEEFDILVDAILAKKNLGTTMDMASFTIGIGPGFEAGKDVHAVIESNRGHNLGRVYYKGKAEKNTNIPGNIGGYTDERVIRSTIAGKIQVIKDIGSLVIKDDTIAIVQGVEVKAKISGLVRGMIQNNYEVFEGMKIADIDPRGQKVNYKLVSDKARSVGGGVLEAICNYKNKIK